MLSHCTTCMHVLSHIIGVPVIMECLRINLVSAGDVLKSSMDSYFQLRTAAYTVVPVLCNPSIEQPPSVMQTTGLGARYTETIMSLRRETPSYVTTFSWRKGRSHKTGSTVHVTLDSSCDHVSVHQGAPWCRLTTCTVRSITRAYRTENYCEPFFFLFLFLESYHKENQTFSMSSSELHCTKD